MATATTLNSNDQLNLLIISTNAQIELQTQLIRKTICCGRKGSKKTSTKRRKAEVFIKEFRDFRYRTEICASGYSKFLLRRANVSSIVGVSDRAFVFAAIGDDEPPFVISDYLTDKSKQPVEKSSCCDLFCDMPFPKRLLCCNNNLS